MPAPDRPSEPILVWGLRAGRLTDLPFDARELLGLEVAEAKELAARHSCRLRVIVEDGRLLFHTQDFKPHRINVATVDSVIVEVLSVE